VTVPPDQTDSPLRLQPGSTGVPEPLVRHTTEQEL